MKQLRSINTLLIGDIPISATHESSTKLRLNKNGLHLMSGGFCFLTLSIRELQREKDKEIKNNVMTRQNKLLSYLKIMKLVAQKFNYCTSLSAKQLQFISNNGMMYQIRHSHVALGLVQLNQSC